jgi:hypothetical protein
LSAEVIEIGSKEAAPLFHPLYRAFLMGARIWAENALEAAFPRGMHG